MVIFEDEHLLVINKPAGLNTHAPEPHAPEGVYEWLRHRQPEWATLSILHRLDKETSGVLVLGKSTLANRSLTRQFTDHQIEKVYGLLTRQRPREAELRVITALVRAGDKYLPRPLAAGGLRAETVFRLAQETPLPTGEWLVEAHPQTGRTHQIRVHAAASGFPILGDTLYGGPPSDRVQLHAASIRLTHPASGEPVTFTAPAPWGQDARAALRTALIDPAETNAWRRINGAADGWPGWQVDQLGAYLLSQSEHPLSDAQRQALEKWLAGDARLCGVYHKVLTTRVRRTQPEEVCPQPVLGEAAPERFVIHENGVAFELSFGEGYSVGLFLDQRDNRRRLLRHQVGAGFPLPEGGWQGREVLNTFAYTCGFSVCAARAGARVTSLDLSKKYLDWGRRNFALNQLDPAAHDFIFGEVFDWLRRLAKKGRLFDLVLLDPPTFSQSREQGVFQAAQDYGRLTAAALAVVRRGGWLFASTNAAQLPPEKFLALVEAGAAAANRRITARHFVPQPPDFPACREQPAYLKTVWLRLDD